MPVINDAVVVNSAYDTSGNGGRKIIRLKNGNLLSTVRNGTVSRFLYKSIDNGNTWIALYSNTNTVSDSALCTDGVLIFRLDAFPTSTRFSMFLDNGSIKQTYDFPTETAIGNVSLAINDAGTELHAAWASKNSAYPSSFNIRYAKGTIATDGSVVWGAVEQVTVLNSTSNDLLDPTIIVDSFGYPHIYASFKNGSNYYIEHFTTKFTTQSSIPNGAINWGNNRVYNGGSYAQSSPSAIFVPQSINGLANGRIWVAWHGADASSSVLKIRVSFSDDGGVTWSPMVIISANPSNVINWFPTITANRRNEVHVIWWENYGATDKRIKKNKNVAGAWGTISEIAGVKEYPSALGFDTSMDFTEPLFIYKDAAKVGFYGSWTVTNSSVPSGDIGAKSNPSNLLSYAITTDGSMSTITEKVNGVTVGTKTATSGQTLNVSLTDAQWDAVEYGKYNKFSENLLPPFGKWGNKSDSGVVINNDKSVTITGINPGFPFIGQFMKVEPHQTYYFTVESSTVNGRIYISESPDGISAIGGGFDYANNLNIGRNVFIMIPKTNYIYIRLSTVENQTNTIIFTNPELLKRFNHPNTLIIEMGTEKWTYTFTKTVNESTTESQLAEALKDMNEVFLPGVKEKLAVPIRSKGGTVSTNPSFDGLVDAIAGIELGKKWATGNVTVNSTTFPFVDRDGNNLNSTRLTVTGISFSPKTIIVASSSGEIQSTVSKDFDMNGGYYLIANQSNGKYIRLTGNATITTTGFNLPIASGAGSYKWIAFE